MYICVNTVLKVDLKNKKYDIDKKTRSKVIDEGHSGVLN
ncbi:hypothetical protein KIS4809_0759 [Bacillus sp. ZZV12-4809]|nr:hypothetical protein KIS4809_0759 [Bacillus sp. ZZV12-4809]